MPSKRSDQVADNPSPSTEPAAFPGPISASPTRIQEPAGVVNRPAGTVTLVARGAAASRSKSVNQIEPVGSPRGRLWTVWRIQIPRPPSGRHAFT